MRSTVGIAAALAVCALALSACAQRQSLPPGPTHADVSTYASSVLFLRQEAAESLIHLGRPDPRPPTYLNFGTSHWDLTMEACLRKGGFVDNATDVGGSLKWIGGQLTDTGTRRLLWFECADKINSGAKQFGIMSAAQRDFLYTYYAKWLVPCMELQGVHVVAPPTRDAFVQDPLRHGWWSPYFALEKPLTKVQVDRLFTACPSTPGGFPVHD